MNEELIERIVSEKERAIRSMHNQLISIPIIIIIGIILSLGLSPFIEWDPYELFICCVFAIGIPYRLFYMLNHRHRPRCPQCGYDWLGIRDNAKLSVKHWKNCPGCGIDLDERILRTKYLK